MKTLLTMHEKVLLTLYRVAPREVRRQIDWQLWDAWTHMPCSLDSDAPETVRFREAVQQLHGQHVSGRALTGFRSFWMTKQLKGGK